MHSKSTTIFYSGAMFAVFDAIFYTKENHQITKEESERRRKGQRTTRKKKKKTENNLKIVISTYGLIITLNLNGLTAPVKRHRMAEWMGGKKKTIYIQPTGNKFKKTEMISNTFSTTKV